MKRHSRRKSGTRNNAYYAIKVNFGRRSKNPGGAGNRRVADYVREVRCAERAEETRCTGAGNGRTAMQVSKSRFGVTLIGLLGVAILSLLLYRSLWAS